MAHGYPDWSPLATGGDSELPTYRYDGGAGFLFGLNSSFVLSVFNPAGSGLIAKLRNFPIAYTLLTGEDGDDSPLFTLWRTTSLGTGSVQTPAQHNTAGAPSGLSVRVTLTVAPAVASQLMSVKLRYERYRELHAGRNWSPGNQYSLYQHVPAGQVQPLSFLPGQGFALDLSAGALGCLARFSPEWTEEPYS